MESSTSQTLPEDVPRSSPSLAEEFSIHVLRAKLESLRQSHHNLLPASSAMDEALNLLRRERDEAVAHTADLIIFMGQISSERDSFLDRVREIEASAREKEDEFAARIKGLKNEAEISRERIEELEIEIEQSSELLLKFADSVRSVKKSLCKIIDNVEEEKIVNGLNVTEVINLEPDLKEELRTIIRLSVEAEKKVNGYKETRKKEKRELENSVVSLTEENRDISNLLRVASLKKEAVGRRLKGNSENKRVKYTAYATRNVILASF